MQQIGEFDKRACLLSFFALIALRALAFHSLEVVGLAFELQLEEGVWQFSRELIE